MMVKTAFETKKTKRIEARVSPEAKERLARAAEYRGCNVTDFILASALAAAEETIRSHEVLQLSARDAEAFYNAIANPTSFDEKMREAVRRHQDIVQVLS